MSDLFPNPHHDESAEDPFVGPNDEFTEGPMGASTVNPIDAARAPKKRLAVFMVAGALAVIVIFMMITLRGGGEETSSEANVRTATGSVDTPQTALVGAPSSDPMLDPLSQPAPVTPVENSYPELSLPIPDDTPFPPTPSDPNAPFGVPGQPTAGSYYPPGQAYPPTYPGQSNVPGDFSAPPVGSYLPMGQPVAQSPTFPGSPTSGGAAPFTDEELDRQARLDAEREAEARRQAEMHARLEAIRAEEARLREKPTLIAENNAINAMTAVQPGVSRFGGSAPSAADPTVQETGDLATAQPNDTYGILPGTQVNAVLVSEFVSDAQGGGEVEARLTQPLRTRRGVILPAGTRAFGMATASGGTAGNPARVAITFNVFLTPDKRVIRDITGQAGDPVTLARSIPGRVDRRMASRIARGIATTVIDFALTSQAQERRSAFEQASPRDEAINDARNRARNLINDPIGDENSEQHAVILDRNTPFVIFFGS